MHNTVYGFIFVGTDFRGLNKKDTFVGFKIRGHCIFFHNSYRKLPVRRYWNSWIGPSMKNKKIGTPQYHLLPYKMQFITRFTFNILGVYWNICQGYTWLFLYICRKYMNDALPWYFQGNPQNCLTVVSEHVHSFYIDKLQASEARRKILKCPYKNTPW